MRFGLLGSVVIENEGSFAEIKPGMPRTILAILLLNANSVVSLEALVETLWGADQPPTATASLHNHVMRLRRMLGEQGGARIRAVSPGYLIEVGPGELDLLEFAELCTSGHAAVRARQWTKAATALAAALSLWRGAPAGDAPQLAGHPEVRRLTEARLQAVEDRIEADLGSGRSGELVGELRTLAAEHPLREAFHAQLMLALHRSGRAAEALEVFQQLRGRLADELGMEPSGSMRRLHRRILDADPSLIAPAEPASQSPGLGGARYQLPTDTRAFTGRSEELDQLTALILKAPVGSDAGMVVISAIDGMGGIGKTTLAVHAAHRAREQFPDGQLFLDLHGYTGGVEPLSAGDALDYFLRSLDVPPQAIPQDLGQRSAFFRDRLHGTRTLLILDNVSSAAQIRPLLPGSPGCLVLVTGRRRLTGLDDAHFLALDILPEADAVALLHKVAGPERIPAHHPAIAELVELCGRMPLAIRITAARLRRHESLRIEDLVGQLRDDSSRLSRLQDEDRALSAVFDLSYQNLSEAEQRLFRLLGLVPGPDFDAYAAAALLGTDRRPAEQLLDSLLDHNLLTQHAADRYQFHDLVRVYARSLTGEQTAAEPDSPLGRLLDYYVYAAQAADRYLSRLPRSEGLPRAAAPTAAPQPPDRPAALAWMRTERDNLTAALAHATAHGQAVRVVGLTAAMTAFLQQEGPWPLAAELHLAAATVAHEHGDLVGEANAFGDLGRARLSTGALTAASGLFERALAIFQGLGDQVGEGAGLWDLGRAQYLGGDCPTAIDTLSRALRLFQSVGHRLGEANALRELAHVHDLIGEFGAAAELVEPALRVFRELGDRLGEANCFWDLGRVRLMTGDYPGADGFFAQALTVYQELGQRTGEANALGDLGQVRMVTGDYAASTGLAERALVIFRSIGHRHGEGYTLLDLARVGDATGDYPAALGALGQAQAIFQDLGHRQGQAHVLHYIGRARAAAGDFDAAAGLLERALEIFRELVDPQSEAEVLNSAGALAARTVGADRAAAHYREALELARRVDSRLDEAHALEGLARCSADLGEPAAALACLGRAVEIYRRIGAAEAAAAQERLAALTGTAQED
jgi:DNA-binding SARP family transcriptional activator/tetratricopeptide (TPR) repeat protein